MYENDIISLIFLWKKYSSKNGVKWDNSFLKWDIPEKIEADFALSLALPISYKRKMAIADVAQEIVSLTENNYKCLRGEFSSSGHINFKFSDEYYCSLLHKIVDLNQSRGQSSGKTILLEYVSANPTGKLHLGAARNAFNGDVLANVYQFLGYQVIREFYINDRGKQIDSLVYSVRHFYCEKQNRPLASNIGLQYQNDIIKEIATFLSKKYGNNLSKEELDPETFEIFRKESLDFLLNKIKTDLQNCGVEFDSWFSESALCQGKRLEKLIQKLKEKKITYQKEGATFLKTTLFGDSKDRVLIKSNGEYTYLLPDILYHENKLSRADVLVDVLGADHHSYIASLKSACQLLGYDQERIKVVMIQMISLLLKEGKTQKFSKRLGNAINLDEALRLWGKSWLRFTLLSKDYNTHLLINKEQLAEDKKNQLYYIQYAHARCHQLLEKIKEVANEETEHNLQKSKDDFSWSDQERKILSTLLKFFFVLQIVVEENKPHHLIYYLTDLAHFFQSYYQKKTIITISNLSKTKQRSLLIKGVKKILKIGLDLCGIEAPNKM